MINNSSLQKWDRLRKKQLSEHFIHAVREGLNCSFFEAQGILDTVYRVFGSYFETHSSLQPGQLRFEVVSESAPPQLPLSKCPLVTVVLTLDAGEEDLRIRESEGVAGLRRHRIERLVHEAYQQGGVLTIEDLANRLLNCGERTLSRDLKFLRQQGIMLPLRSTVKDMGRGITHRRQIIMLYLAGKEYSEIAQASCHSVGAVANYVEKFKRLVALLSEDYDVNTISFLIKLSPTLVKEYVSIYHKSNIIAFRKQELESYLKKDPSPLIVTQNSERGLI